MNPALLDAPETAVTLPRTSGVSRIKRALITGFGLAWRTLVGAILCGSVVGAVFVLGWLNRRTEALIVRYWWRKGAAKQERTFAEFCDAYGHDAPTERPRWFWRERIAQVWSNAQSPWQKLWVILSVPLGSLIGHLWAGLRCLFGTFLLVGFGCVLMTFGWTLGWYLSFYKVYEMFGIGPGVSLGGMALFALAMLYVPMAQAHFAVTGHLRAFVDFAVLRKLIRARLGWYTAFAGLVLLMGLLVEILKTLPAAWPNMYPRWYAQSTDAERLQLMEQYVFRCGLVLFALLLVMRQWMAWLYASAVLRALRLGWLRVEELPGSVQEWLRRTQALPPTVTPPTGVGAVLLAGGEKAIRWPFYTALFVIWFLFAAKTYIGEFFLYHPVLGFLNHPLVMVPAFDIIPESLRLAGR